MFPQDIDARIIFGFFSLSTITMCEVTKSSQSSKAIFSGGGYSQKSGWGCASQSPYPIYDQHLRFSLPAYLLT